MIWARWQYHSAADRWPGSDARQRLHRISISRMNLPIELTPIDLASHFSAACPSSSRLDGVLLISSRLRLALSPSQGQGQDPLVVSLASAGGHPRTMLLSTQPGLLGLDEPALAPELERLGRWIDREDRRPAARFRVCVSHALAGRIHAALAIHPAHPLQLSLATPIPLAAVLLELIHPPPGLPPLDSPALQAELTARLPRIIRQAELIPLQLALADPPGETRALSAKVLLTEPVLQGLFLPTQTTLTLVAQAHPPPPSPPTAIPHTHINGAPATSNPLLDGSDDFEDLGRQEDELEIDTNFLAHSVLNQPLLDLSSYPRATSSLGHPCHALPLLDSPHQTPAHSPGAHPNDDDGFHCLARTVDLIKIGVQSGDWLLLTKPSPADEDGRQSPQSHQHRLVRIIACDDHHPAILNLRQHHPQFDSHPSRQAPALILVPPVLLLNLLGTVSYSAALRAFDLERPAPLNALPAGLPFYRQPALPTIRSLTLARLASPQALTKSYQPAFLRALKKYFEQKPRVLRDGDVIAIAIDGESARFAEPHPSSQTEPSTTEDLDPEHLLPSSLASYPTLPIYFKATNLQLSYPTFDQAQTDPEHGHQDSSVNQPNRSNPLLPIGEMMEDGVLGGIVDPKMTKLVQTGLEFGFVPDAKNWLGIDSSTPLFYSPQNASNSQSPERILYEYLLAAARVESRNYDLNLTVLISGPRGSGKSTLTKRAVEATGFNFLELNCFDLLGETEVKTAGTLRARFERALQAIPCVLLLRHLDGLARKSQSLETGQQPGIIAILKECFNDARRNWTSQSAVKFPLIIVGTTTDPDLLPLSLLALFKTQLAIEAPSEAERLEIIKELLRKDVLAPDVSLKSIALETAGLVANDLVHLVSQARMAAVTRARKDGTGIEQLASAGIQLMAKDIEKALGKARSEYSESIGAPRIPKVSWDDIGGLAKVREEILETVQLPIQHPELFANGLKRRSGLLLYGPPGTGKTLLAKAVATSCGLNFFSVKGPELLNMYIGESEANVRRVFERARGARPCVIFFDELDSVAPKRGNQGDSGGVMDRIVSQLLAELDGISSGASSNDNQQEGAANSSSGNGEVVVIGATNRPDLLDPALLRPGRFDKLIYLGIPTTRDQKLEILKSLTRKFTLSSGFDFGWLIEEIDRIGSQKGSGNIFTGADFYSICSEALMASLIRKIERLEALKAGRSVQTGEDGLEGPGHELDEHVGGAVTEVGPEDFLVALRQVKPSISASELAHYRIIQDQFSDETRQTPANHGPPPPQPNHRDPTNDTASQQTIQFDFSPAKNKGKSREVS